VVALILTLVGLSWWTRGIADATALFQLLQGVLLAVIAFLWGSQAADKAEARAASESESRQRMTATAVDASRELEELKQETQRLRTVLTLLAADADVRAKIEDALRRVGEVDDR